MLASRHEGGFGVPCGRYHLPGAATLTCGRRSRLGVLPLPPRRSPRCVLPVLLLHAVHVSLPMSLPLRGLSQQTGEEAVCVLPRSSGELLVADRQVMPHRATPRPMRSLLGQSWISAASTALILSPPPSPSLCFEGPA